MRERILEFLLNAASPQPSSRILAGVLNTCAPNERGAEAVVRAIVRDDPRFGLKDGLWSAIATSPAPVVMGYPCAIALFAQSANRPAGPICLRGALCRKDSGESLLFELTPTSKMPDREALGRWQAEIERELLVAWSDEMVRLWTLVLQAWRMERNPGPVVTLRDLAAQALHQNLTRLTPESAASLLGLPAPDSERPADMARFFLACLEALLELVPQEHRYPVARLLDWIDARRPRIDFSQMAFGRDYLRSLPETPGVYIMRNRGSDILYIGKAGNLRRRVASYFGPAALVDPKTARIHEQLHSLETVTTATELDALLLETQMIRDFRPPVNLQTEIHERPARYGKGRNLVLLAPQPGEGKVNLYFLRDGTFEGQRLATLGKPAPRSLRDRIRKIYFPARGNRRKYHEAWEMEIAASWLARHRREINFVDVDDAGDFESALRRLDCYLCDPDRLIKKVIYR